MKQEPSRGLLKCRTMEPSPFRAGRMSDEISVSSQDRSSFAAYGPRYNALMSHPHTIHQSHLGWDNSLEPAARIAPGEILQFDVLDAAGGQLSPASTVE